MGCSLALHCCGSARIIIPEMWKSELPSIHTMQIAALRFRKCGTFTIAWLLVLTVPGFCFADELVTLANVVDPGQVTADELVAEVFSAEKAARYLDTASLHWQKSRNCVACHVNMGYMFARLALSLVLNDSREVRGLFEEYVTKRWKDRPPRNSQEIVVVASGFAIIVARELGVSSNDPKLRRGIDRIACEGARFRNAFCTTPLCSPVRASLLTGLYAHNHGIIDNTNRSRQSHELATFPRILHENGYETGYIGKWHMGNDDTSRPGFDYWACMAGQAPQTSVRRGRNSPTAQCC